MIYQFFYIKKCIQNSYVDIIKTTLNENLILMFFYTNNEYNKYNFKLKKPYLWRICVWRVFFISSMA